MEKVRSSADPQGLSSPVRASRSPSSSVRAMEEELVGVDSPDFLTNVLWRPLEQAWNEVLENNSGNEAARVEDPVGNHPVERVDEPVDVTNSTEAPGPGIFLPRDVC